MEFCQATKPKRPNQFDPNSYHWRQRVQVGFISTTDELDSFTHISVLRILRNVLKSLVEKHTAGIST